MINLSSKLLMPLKVETREAYHRCKTFRCKALFEIFEANVEGAFYS